MWYGSSKNKDGIVMAAVGGVNAKASLSQTTNGDDDGLWRRVAKKVLLLGLGSLFAFGTMCGSGNVALAYGNGPQVSEAWGSPTGVPSKPAFLESKEPMPSVEDFSSEEIATIRLFQQNTPTVVNISNIINARTPFSMDILQLPQGQGSGFIWDSQGHVVTNYHVIRGAANLKVSLIDQTVVPAKVIGGDPSKDIAVLQLEAPPEVLRELKPVSLGKSSSLFVGQKVFAIGNPFGLDHTLTSGIISGLNRELSAEGGPSLRNVIQTDAAINPGN